MDSTRWTKIKELFMTVFDLPENERAAFLDTCDPDLRSEVERLLRADIDAGKFINKPAVVDLGLAEEQFPDHYIGQQIDAYKIVKEIGHGGMGTVYLARRADASFEKQVALKLIKRGMDTNAVLKRFVLERRILAQLQHRFIANLLDGGSTADGLPYFVMEHVEGLPITKFCDSHEMSINERLELFRKVCSAISYAHQNLVIHRDIKPSNIMVTEDGVPKLLDFGIAKLLHPDWSLDTNEATATMFRVLTPEYASPEQMQGLPITTTSDVYSLGVVLYELLCGTRPFRLEGRMPDEAAQIVLTQEPLRPSSVVSSEPKAQSLKSQVLTEENGKPTTTNNARPANPKSKIRNPKSLRGDLDNIVLKALSKEPERRYQSVQEFSEDIRRRLVGLPVTATADSLAYRMAKFVKRHRTAVVAGGAVLLILLAATAVTTWQATVARRERDRADQRFNQVRKLAHTVLFDYHDGIAELAGSTPIREKMVKDALEYLDNLASESAGDVDLQRELAAAYEKVGDVQGDPFGANLGNYKGALESYKKALAIRQIINSTSPENTQSKLDLIRSYEAVGGMSQAAGDIASALENYQQAFAVFDSFKDEDMESKRELSILQRRFAKALAANGKLAEAVENYRKSIIFSDELILSNPNEQNFKRDLALTNISLGDALVEADNLNDALTAERAAYALLEPLIVSTDAQSRRMANTAYTRVSKILALMGDHQGALEIELKALAIDESLANADPTNALARRDVYVDHLKVARQQAAVGDMKSALINQLEFIDLCKAEIALSPGSSDLRTDLAVGYLRYGEMLEKNHNLPAAFEIYKQMLSMQEVISSADPANARQRRNLAEILTIVSDRSLKLGILSNVLEGYQKALLIREEFLKANPEIVEARTQIALVYKGLGEYFMALAQNGKDIKNWQEAKNKFQESLDILTESPKNNSSKVDDTKQFDEIKQKIAKCQTALAKVQRQ